MWVFMCTVEQYNLRLFNRPDIHSFIKSKRLEWFGHAWMRYHDNIMHGERLANFLKMF